LFEEVSVEDTSFEDVSFKDVSLWLTGLADLLLESIFMNYTNINYFTEKITKTTGKVVDGYFC
jgi:hypothetical protein